MKQFTLVFSLVLSFVSIGINAQSNIGISGRLVEVNSQQPIEFATVVLANKETEQPITGTTTSEDGSFYLEAENQDFIIEVSFIGFQKKTIDQFQIKNGRVNLGIITLQEDQQALDEVVVRGEKSQTVFKLDKRVFNVGKDLSSTGASALEVLNNVPSVNVNIEGQISLRGSQGVQILINGKPSVLANQGSNALGTITADMIDSVEVITNPSAKYEAEGTSGIINIVLKKEEKQGLNGSITANVGIPTNHSVGISLNKRTEKFNLFTQLGVGRRTFPSDRITENNDFINDTFLRNEGESEKSETFYNILLGTDYHINKNNVITLSGTFTFEDEDENSDTNFRFLESNELTQSWNRTESTEATNPKWQYELQYKKDFENHEDHDLLFSALGSFFGKDQSSTFNDRTIFGDRENFVQQTATDFKEARYTFKLDYTYPFAGKYTLEIGSQYVMNNVSNDYEVGTFEGGVLVIDPDLTNLFEFDQGVLGVYSTLGYEGEKWGLKGGLRLENTDLNTLLQTTGQSNDRNYTNLFPSVHTSYKISEAVSLQAGYSRRIYRPRLWDLNPFFNIRNNFNISTGNPNLQPEFTNAYELTSIFKIGKASFNLGTYYRYTTDVIEDVTTFEDGVSTSFPINVGTNNTVGVEFNSKYSPAKWMSLMADFNWNSFNRKGDFEGTSLDFDGTRWSSRMTAKVKLPWDMDLEVAGNYRSSFQTIQGEQEDNVFANLGLRKKIFKGKIVANLSVRDVFASRVFEFRTLQPDFSTYNRRQSGRFVTFGLSYGFGKGEAMEYSARKRF